MVLTTTTTTDRKIACACKDFRDNDDDDDDDDHDYVAERAGPNVVVGEDETTEAMMMEDVELGKEATASASITTAKTTRQGKDNAAAATRQKEQTAATADAAIAATDNTNTNSQKSCCSPPKILIGLVLVALIVFVIIDSSTTGHVRRAVQDFLEWIEDNAVAGIFLFIMVYFVATVFFIPGSLLTLGAGFVFASAFGLGPGVALGTLVVFVGAATGALAAFCLGRYLLREAVTSRLSSKYAVFQALDHALLGNGLKIFILLRLSPVVPFSILNYVAGVTAVSMRDYALALFAILPGTLLYVFLGASAGSLADNADGESSKQSPTVTIIVIVFGVVLGVAAVYLTTRYARQELNRILAERNDQAHQAEEAQEEGESP